MIPKPGGGERPLGIPTIRDRVAQTAARIVLEPTRGGLRGSAYGYRPRRSALDAVKEAHRLICRGHTDVVDADLSKYFDTIPHADLLRSVARRIVDRQVLRLIKLWLKAPVEGRDGGGKRRMTGGKSNPCGTPQGGVISPLLARRLHESVPEALAADQTRRSVSRTRRLVRRRLRHPQPRLCGGSAGVDEGGDDEAGLTLNEAKTSLKDARKGTLRVPWLRDRPAPLGNGWTLVPEREPIQEECPTGQDKGRRTAGTRQTKGPWLQVPAISSTGLLSGWSAYFSYGTRVDGLPLGRCSRL